MSKYLTITKDYTVDRPFSGSLEQLDTIISTPFNSSKFSIFGNFISKDPPEFIFMAKWISIGRPMFAEIASTKILVRLFNSNGQTKIEIKTITNPIILIFFFCLLVIFIIQLLTYKNFADLAIAGIYLLLSVLSLGFDRFIKNILIAAFESDLKLTSG